MTKKIHFEGPIFTICDELAKLGKASYDAFNLGGWLILKNWVVKGVTSEVNDFSQKWFIN